MKNLLSTLIAFTLSSTLWAQHNDLLYCGADEMRIQTLQQSPKIAEAVIQRDQVLENFTGEYVRNFYNGSNRSASYTIPVVFHIIHNFGNENISDAQILDGLDVLNKTFRKQLADTASIVVDFKPIHADCDIEFKLAQIDPDGNCTNGINRIASPLTDIGDHSVKALIHWPPHQYLNVYVVKNAAGLAGHCVWPADADTIPGWDGIVIGHNYVGTIGTSNYTQSVAFAHECGHYLNLHHIWGGNNVPGFYYLPCGDTINCTIGDDFVADTPPTKGWQTCSLAGASCGNAVDNVQNAMDYSYCNRMFTIGQKARMHACLNSPIAGRNNLWSPANLAATGVLLSPAPLCKADFTSNKTVICPTPPNNTIAFTNTSYSNNFTNLEWTFAGGTPATSTAANPTVTYNAPGTYDVHLKVMNATDTVEVLKEKFIKVLPTTSGYLEPYNESFETIASLHGNDWFLNNIAGTNNWNLDGTHAYTGTWSVMLDNFNHTGPGGSRDELIGPVIDLSGATALRFAFRYAYAHKDAANDDDKLILYITNNCNITWTQRIMLTGSALETAPPTATFFSPSGPSEWKQVSATIPSSFLTDDFRFKFVHTSYGGNNLYIDDINIDVTASVDNLQNAMQSLQVFPNPAGENLNLVFEIETAESLQVSIVDMLGKTVYISDKKLYMPGKHQLNIDLGQVAAGMYRVQLGNGVNAIGKTLVTGR